MPALRDLTIGRLARRAGCNVPTIRYYEEIGLLPKARRGAGQQRVYGEEEARRLLYIRRCRDLGFPIEQIRALVALVDTPGRDCGDARALAQSQLEAVRRKRNELLALERTLRRFVEDCDSGCSGGPVGDCVIVERLCAPEARSRNATRV